LEYWIGRAYAHIDLPAPQWARIVEDARAAQALNPDAPAVHGLLGYVALKQARLEKQRAEQIQKLEQAEQSLARALSLVKEDDRDRPIYLLNRSFVCLELGNYVGKAQRKKQEDYLYRARDLAAEAARGGHPYPYLVQEAWGNALEDIAMYLEKPDQFAEAIARFSKAIEIRYENAHGYVSRGRCRYRWVLARARHDDDAAVLGDAMKDLGKAAKFAPQSRDAVEAHYWQGVIYLHPAYAEQDRSQARAAFARVLAVGQKYPGLDWTTFAREQLAAMSLAEARMAMPGDPARAIARADEGLKVVASPDAAGEPTRQLKRALYEIKGEAALAKAGTTRLARVAALTEARACATELERLDAKAFAAYLRAGAYDVEDNFAKARAECQKGLALETQPTELRGMLLLCRTRATAFTQGPSSFSKLLPDVEQAAKLIKTGTQKVSALALASLFHTSLGIQKDDRKHIEAAVEHARQAIQAEGKGHPERAAVRLLLARGLSYLARSAEDAKTRRQQFAEALQRANEAYQMRNLLDEGGRTLLDQLIESLRREQAGE
jgi:hypothetical protein